MNEEPEMTLDDIHNRISALRDLQWYANREWNLQLKELKERAERLKDGQ